MRLVDSMKHQHKIILLLILIILFGLCLRVHNVGLKSFQMDELFINNYIQPEFEGTVQIYKNINFVKPPAFYFMLHFWKKLGDSETAMRLFSVLFSVLSIPLVFLIGKRVFNEKTGLLSALFVAVSASYIFVSQELKVFSLLSFLFLLSAYSVVRAIQDKDNRFWFLFSFVTLLALFTNYISIYFVIILNAIIFLLCRKKGILKQWVLSQIGIGFFFLPWFIYMLTRLKYMRESFVMAGGGAPSTVFAFGMADLGKNIYNIIGALVQLNFGAFLNFNLVKSYAVVIIPILAILGYFLWEGWNSPEKIKRASLLAVLLLSLVLFSLHGYFNIIGIPLDVKHVIPFAFGYFILLAKGVSTFDKNKRVFYSAIAFVIVLSIACTFIQYPFGEEDWYGVNNFISENSQPDDVILIYPNWISLAFDRYYDDSLDVIDIPKEYPNLIDYKQSDVVYMTEENVQVLESATIGHDRAWYVVRKRAVYEPYNLVTTWLTENGELLKQEKIQEVELFLYKLNTEQK